MTRDEFLGVLEEVLGPDRWPKPLHVLRGQALVERGTPLEEAARLVGTSRKRLEQLAAAPDPITDILGLSPKQVDVVHREKSIQILGQLLLGRAAEAAFEDIYKAEIGTADLTLKDLRESRTDTDYRVYNGRGRPVYRVNIKFHGARFRRASELVGLDPEDCFALATYKIHSALQKQQEDQLPYLFAIVGVSDLSGGIVGERIPSRFIESVALFHQAPKAGAKRDFEDRIVEALVKLESPVYQETYRRIRAAEWYVLSARRADQLLKALLFDRVFALRIRNFARAFGRAELDMHFSVSADLIPLRMFLKALREGGTHRVTTLLERGDF